MVMIIFLLVVKTFFFLRIIESFTSIVIMLIRVMGDLKVFLLFYNILILIYALIFSVIGIGLSNVQTAEDSTASDNASRLLGAEEGR
jgi:hypothetical protein